MKIKKNRPISILPQKIEQSLDSGSSETFTQDEEAEMLGESLGAVTLLIVGFMKGCNNALNEGEAYDFIAPKLMDGLTYNQAVWIGKTLSKVKPHSEDGNTLQ